MSTGSPYQPPGWAPPPGMGPPAYGAPPSGGGRHGFGSVLGAFVVGVVVGGVVCLVGLVIIGMLIGDQDTGGSSTRTSASTSSDTDAPTVLSAHDALGEGADVPAVGSCLVPSPHATDLLDAAHIGSCASSHRSEVVGVVAIPSQRMPTADDIDYYADGACLLAFQEYVGSTYEDSILDYFAVRPSEAAWRAGDRRLFCVADTTDAPAGTGSVKGSGL
mgnify:CR=1 FL=1